MWLLHWKGIDWIVVGFRWIAVPGPRALPTVGTPRLLRSLWSTEGVLGLSPTSLPSSLFEKELALSYVALGSFTLMQHTPNMSHMVCYLSCMCEWAAVKLNLSVPEVGVRAR